MTVGELRKALAGLPADFKIIGEVWIKDYDRDDILTEEVDLRILKDMQTISIIITQP